MALNWRQHAFNQIKSALTLLSQADVVCHHNQRRVLLGSQIQHELKYDLGRRSV
jgi:hypothetical protein